jgi:hypothetical protein
MSVKRIRKKRVARKNIDDAILKMEFEDLTKSDNFRGVAELGFGL